MLVEPSVDNCFPEPPFLSEFGGGDPSVLGPGINCLWFQFQVFCHFFKCHNFIHYLFFDEIQQGSVSNLFLSFRPDFKTTFPFSRFNKLLNGVNYSSIKIAFIFPEKFEFLSLVAQKGAKVPCYLDPDECQDYHPDPENTDSGARIDVLLLTREFQGIDHEFHSEYPREDKYRNVQELKKMVISACKLEKNNNRGKRNSNSGCKNESA